MKKYRPLTDVYGSIYGNAVPKPPRQSINENVTIDFDFVKVVVQKSIR